MVEINQAAITISGRWKVVKAKLRYAQIKINKDQVDEILAFALITPEVIHRRLARNSTIEYKNNAR